MSNSEGTSGSGPKPLSPSNVDDTAEEEDLSNKLKNVRLGEDKGKMVMSVSEAEMSEVVYPLRPGVKDCSFYMRTGSCNYGSICKFNHPLPKPVTKDKLKEKEEDADKPGPMDCKYFFKNGWCRNGVSCRFNHTKPNSSLPSRSKQPELNFLGLPIRPGKIECPFYMQHGSCRFGPKCRYDHPDPKIVEADSPLFHGKIGESVGSQVGSNSWSSPGHVNVGPSQTPNEWSLFSYPTTYLMNNSLATAYLHHQIPAEEFPDRPDQPECSYYMKTGDCKFKFICKNHHPKNRLPKDPPVALTDNGLPLRPGENICPHYSRFGLCKFGPACKYDHSVLRLGSVVPRPGSLEAIVETHQESTNGNESDG